VPEYVLGGIVNTVSGALLAFFFHLARRREGYVNRTIDELIQRRLLVDDRERMIIRFRWMLLFGMGFALLFMALGVASIIVGLSTAK
jgi:hypothetical protein